MHKQCLPETARRVLRKLSHIIERHEAVLAGGSALALHLGHRLSMDLDFFTVKEIDIEAVIIELRERGIRFQVISEGENELIVDIEGVKVSLFRYPYPFLEMPASCEGIKVAGSLDIAAMKVIAVCQRGTKRDFIDLYFLLQEIPFHRVAEHMLRRFGRERINSIHIGKSLVYFSDAESDPEPRTMKKKNVEWGKIKKFFRTHVRQFVYDLDAAMTSREPPLENTE